MRPLTEKAKTPATDLRDKIVTLAFERGVLFLGAGESAIRLSPPLIVTQEQADIAMNTLEECITLAAKHA